MQLATRIFTLSQEKELNEFLKTAHLYHTDSLPAIRFVDGHIVVMHKPSPGTVAPFIAAETIYSHIAHNRETMVEDEMKIRQFKWRIEEKKARITEIEALKAPLEKELAAVIAKQSEITGKDRKGEKYQVLQKRRNEIGKELSEFNKELNGEGPKDAGLAQQIENAEADIKVTLEKIEDRKKDIDTGLAFAAEIESGEFKIYRQ